MFSREAADTWAACIEVAGSGGVLQTVQVEGGAEDRGDTLSTITAGGGGGGGGHPLQCQINLQ